MRSTTPAVTLSICLFTLAGCSAGFRAEGNLPTSGPEYVPAKVQAQGQVKGRPTFGNPVTLPVSNWLMFPFAMETARGFLNFDEGISVTAGAKMMALDSMMAEPVAPAASQPAMTRYWGPAQVRWNNIAFADPANGQSTLLFDRRVLIVEYQVLNTGGVSWNDAHRYSGGGQILFKVIEADTSGDGEFDPEDAVVAYVTDLRGGNLRRISPQGARVLEVRPRGDGSLWVVVRQDSDGDRRFTTHDTIQAYIVKDDQFTPVPSLDVQNRAAELFK